MNNKILNKKINKTKKKHTQQIHQKYTKKYKFHKYKIYKYNKSFKTRKSTVETLIKKKKELSLKDYLLTYITNDKHYDYYGPNVKPLYNDLKKIGIDKSIESNKNHFIGFYVSKEFYKTQFYVINMIQNLNSILDKSQLFFNLKTYFPSYYQNCVPYSFQLTLESKIEPNEIYLAKPIFSVSGKGIINVINDETLNAAKHNLKQYPDGIVMSRYIKNPLLFKGKKMHLRCYFMISIINNVFKSYLLETGKILTAKLPYIEDDYLNKDIHDSHVKSTECDYFFPEDLIKHKSVQNMSEFYKIMDKIRIIFNIISKIGFTTFEIYPNAKNAYEIYGADFIVTQNTNNPDTNDNFNVYILEINDSYTGYSGKSEETKLKIGKLYSQWIHDCIINPILHPDIPIPDTLSNKPIVELIIN
jgi:glutathione synthase/RimK-type ligase-like ATP-grasp enzyme